MALVTCPKCKKIVSDTSKVCPNCGGSLKSGPFDNNNPKAKKLHTLSNVFLSISCVLLFIEILNVAKTYVGAILFGVGFLMQGLSLLESEKEKGYDGKKRARIIIVLSIAFMIIGIVFLYLDLK